MAKVYLGLGTNMGDKEMNLRTAVQWINDRIGEVTSLSSFYETAPWGFVSDNSFLNGAVCVETELMPLEVLHRTQAIERELGRTHKSVNGVYSDRIIDIDLLLYEDVVMQSPELTLPHPRIGERGFVLAPLRDLFPDGRILDADFSEAMRSVSYEGIKRREFCNLQKYLKKNEKKD